MTTKFVATFDAHSGFERKGGHKVPLHDPKAWSAVVKFAQDFKPDVWIHGGDIMDCGVISHHNKNKPGNLEGRPGPPPPPPRGRRPRRVSPPATNRTGHP